MKWLATRKVSLADIRLPEDWDERLHRARKGELAAAIKRTQGPIHLPVFDVGTMEIVAGVDRIAALAVGGEATFEVREWSGSEAERRYVRASENAHRRLDHGRWVKEVVSALEAMKSEDRNAQLLPSLGSNSVRKGRPKSAKGEARERAAKELGTTPQAVRRQEQRQEAKERPEAPAAPAVVSPERKLQGLSDEITDLGDAIKRFQAEIASRVDDAWAWANAQPAGTVNPSAPSMRWVGQYVAQAWGLVNDVADALSKALVELRRVQGHEKTRPVPEQASPRTGLGGRRLDVVTVAPDGTETHHAPEDLADEPHDLTTEYDPTDEPPGEPDAF